MLRILVVDAENICLSPMFAAEYSRALRLAGRDVTVESAGYVRSSGRQAVPELIESRSITGLDFTGHRSRCIWDLDLSRFDTIICLDLQVANEILGQNKVEVVTVLRSILDPSGHGEAAYRDCRKIIGDFIQRQFV